MNDDATRYKALIRDEIENWAMCRDSGDWDAFASVLHADAVMIATWRQSRANVFTACTLG